MDKELQTMGQNIPQKELLVNFVQDVADMEARAFSMREAADRCRNDAANIIVAAKEQMEKKEQEVEVAKCLRDKHVSCGVSKPNLKKRYFCEPFVELMKWYLFLAGEEGLWILISAGILIPVAVLTLVYSLLIDPFVVMPIQNKKRVKEYNIKLQIATDEYECKLGELNIKLHDQEMQLADEQSRAENEFLRAKAINSRADELIASAETVEQNVLQCYKLNIIKPAYQNLVCVTIINEIFRNDKADTMREAMILCDEAVRHQDGMKTLNNILGVLGSIAGYMRELKDTLRSINLNISVISQDVSRIADNQVMAQKQNQTMQARIAYATESIKQSSDNADFYIAQRRAGIL